MHLKMESDLLLSLSPSFNSYCSVNLATVDRVVNEHQTHSSSTAAFVSKFQNSSPANYIHVGQERKDQISNDFEFSSVCRDSESSPVSAEDIFHNGQIRPVFPISKRDLCFGDKVKTDGKKSSVRRRIPLGKLFSEDRDPTPSSSPEEDEDLKRIPVISMDRASSGRNEKRWRFRNILQRSNSEAKDSFVSLSPKRSRSKNQNLPQSPKACVDKRRAKFVSGGEAVTSSSSPQEDAAGLYLRNRPAKEADRRRSFLPYRRDLIGFFANVY